MPTPIFLAASLVPKSLVTPSQRSHKLSRLQYQKARTIAKTPKLKRSLLKRPLRQSWLSRFKNLLVADRQPRNSYTSFARSPTSYSRYSTTQGIQGDFITFSKYINSSITFRAFRGYRDLIDLFNPTKNRLFHPDTYNNNILSIHAGLIGLDIYNTSKVNQLNKLSKYLKTKVQ
ncbi:uncharacterized protein FPRO_03844 [Fusarium proliferatum ET1]|uniref:Uncharacterized protein n=1 Tax=Fusarium proliferatum (strain ET1) TaxID=1227346 RepID=A0A1L7V8P4_FUSPR|nr:uncharacterized protein FPRO_03844 [Fusarium proliferatum ET1]CZR35896.1 uncharacterized protein FPRO_03844 [Fusarium proliferatum ET1]